MSTHYTRAPVGARLLTDSDHLPEFLCGRCLQTGERVLRKPGRGLVFEATDKKASPRAVLVDPDQLARPIALRLLALNLHEKGHVINVHGIDCYQIAELVCKEDLAKGSLISRFYPFVDYQDRVGEVFDSLDEALIACMHEKKRLEGAFHESSPFEGVAAQHL